MKSTGKTRLVNCMMDSTGKLRERCSYLGVFIAFLTLCLPMYWGNLSVYSESYFRYGLHPPQSSNTAWMVPCFNFGGSVSSLFAGTMKGFIGKMWTMIFTCVLLDAGVFLSFFSVQHSAMGLNLSLGLLNGLGMGLMMNTGLHHVLSCQPKNAGLVTGFITGATYLGGAVLNQVVTWYVNPNNLSPNRREERQIYFTQPEVLEKVPSVFLVFGVIHLCCHMVGIFLMKQNVKRERDLENNSILKIIQDEKERESSEDHSGTYERTDLIQQTGLLEKDTASQTKDDFSINILKTKAFYVLFLVNSSFEYSDIIMTTFYKVYGQIWISDDQFIAFFTSMFLVIIVLIRPIVGVFVDACGVKYSIVCLGCIACIITSFWYFTPMVSKWFYIIWTLAYACNNSSFKIAFPVAVLKVFGSERFSNNYGILIFSTVLINLTAPHLARALVKAHGWFYLFVSVGFATAFATFATVLWFPKK